MIKNYVVLDLETTGLNPKLDKIIEVGAVKVVQGKQTDFFETMVNPGRKLKEQTTEITGIKDEDLENAPYLEEVLPKLLDFIGENCLVGHRILFDYSFVKKAAVNAKRTFERDGVDTLKIARKYLPDLEHKTLGYLCGHYEIPLNAHRALEDAKATGLLYEKLWEEFGNEENKKDFQPQKLTFQVKKDTPASKAQKERLYQLIEQHKINNDMEIDKLTRSEASRYTDQIYARYGR